MYCQMIAFYLTKDCQTVCFKTDRNVKKLADATAFLGIKNEKMISLFELSITITYPNSIILKKGF